MSFKKDQIRLRLQQIELANNGRLTANDVVEDAKNPESPLHDMFDWNVDRAAHQHWLRRAREIIVSIKVVEKVQEERIECVYYVRDPHQEHDQQGYVSLTTLKSEEQLAMDALRQEFLRAKAIFKRARDLSDVLEIRSDVVDVSDRIDMLLERV